MNATGSIVDRRTTINTFITWCNQPHHDYFDLTKERADEIANHYFAPLRVLSDASVRDVLEIMRISIGEQTRRANEENKRIPIDQWKGCCTGVADFLLRPQDLDGRDRIACASALQRLSGWYHAWIPLWAPFRPAAKQIGDILCCNDVLQYLKIGEEWTFDMNRVDPHLLAKSEEGLMTLWDFAKSTPNAVRTVHKRDDEISALASRLLNFLCEQRYLVFLLERSYNYIVSQFPGNDPCVLPTLTRERDRHPLLRWSIESDFVPMLTTRLWIKGPQLMDFLQQNNFTPNRTHNPPAEQRLAWFQSWRRVTPKTKER